ncbi:DUF3180 domain-containing protein [Dermabacter sp. p3-SID358]|uniref:DUF3180 domain-containing protein n=1 Tax=Dermabacter sp. p3-SID358 TaxID=2916114 RepID=UPI0021A73199|nr:DUF3180 domain-containing protein [Dermabacter sp. p3-SID358]MCT1867377.1 DUF3180 domain-containing protein [Dermabacter sp. p3-SID358]
MKKTPALRLLGIALVAGLGGHAFSLAFASRGEPVPVAGLMPGAVFLIIAGIVLYLGLRVKRYLDESRERAKTHPLTPRKHHIDMVVAYRIILAARAAAYTGAIGAGFYAGMCTYLAISGGGTLAGAILPLGFDALSALALAIIGLIVERWGTLPPNDRGSGGRAEEGASSV